MGALDNLKAKLQAVFKKKSEKAPAAKTEEAKPAETAPPAADATKTEPTETATAPAPAGMLNAN